MNKVITRNWICEKAHFSTEERGISKEYLFSVINYWKKILIEKGAKSGDKIGFAVTTMDISYIAILFASFELGLKLTILLKPNNHEDWRQPKFNIYFPLDFVFLDRFSMKLFPDLREYYTKNSKQSIDVQRIGYNFPINEKYSKKVKKIYATPNNDCLLCTSSGSTGEPKLINHSHEFFYDLCSFNWQPLEFTEEDRVLHLVTFNHGSSLGIFFLPSLHICKWHYFGIKDFNITVFNDENYENFISFCQRNKITKVQSPFDYCTDFMISSIENSKVGCPDLTIFVLSFINPKWLNVVKSGKLKKIVSIFGCSETSGPLFLPYIDKDTENFNPYLLGKPVQGFHGINVINENLIVTIPTYNKTIDTEDSLSETKYGYVFKGKKKAYRLNDIEINIFVIRGIVGNYFEKIEYVNLIVLVDEVYKKLYIVTDKVEIMSLVDKIKDDVKKFYNNQVELDDIVYIKNIHDFVVGIKPDRARLLTHIRQVRNEQY